MGGAQHVLMSASHGDEKQGVRTYDIDIRGFSIRCVGVAPAVHLLSLKQLHLLPRQSLDLLKQLDVVPARPPNRRCLLLPHRAARGINQQTIKLDVYTRKFRVQAVLCCHTNAPEAALSVRFQAS